MDLRYLAEILEDERDRNSEFRDEVRTKLAGLERWIAVRDAIEADRIARVGALKKGAAWIAGTVVTILGILVPVLLSR
jgi:hypothetical protein